MHVRFAFLLAVGLLATPTTFAQSSSDASSATTPEGTSAAPSSGSAGTTNAASTVPQGSSASPDPSATTPNPATQPSGATTPGGSDSPTGAPTAGGSTVSAGPTTSAPLPNVTVSIVQFDNATCDDEVCTYSISAPRNDQILLATEDSIIAADRTQFLGLQNEADSKDANIKKANDDAQAKINELQTLLNNIQTNLNSIQGNIVTIRNQQSDAKATLQFVQNFINDVNNAKDTCLYQRCLKPTTPAPPTTTPTPAPTTPPSPCVNFTCPGDVDGSQHCHLDTFNKPNCDNCDGNFNAYDHCDTVACSSLGTGFALDATGYGVLYSTGYNSSSPASSVVPAGANCKWNLNGTFEVPTDNSPVAYNTSCLASNNVIMYLVSSDGFSQLLSSGLSLRSINKALAKIPNPTFTLTATNAETTYCSFPLHRTDLPTPATFAVEKKQNGFFSWLMGY